MDLSNKTKTIIRSLLISSPKSLTMHDLDSDYLKYEGHGIPFARLGYPNLKQFLSSIPDILNITYSGEILPVATNSRSYHIQKFVASNASTDFDRFNDTYRYPRPHPRVKLDYSYRDMDRTMSNQLDVNTQPRQTTDFIGGDKMPFNTIDRTPIVDNVAVSKQLESKRQEDIQYASNEGLDDRSALPFVDEDDPIHLIGLGLPLSNVGVKIPGPALTVFKPGHTYDVFVTEINRPSRFWFCLSGDNVELNEMEEQLKLLDDDDVGKVTMRSFEMVAQNSCLVTYKQRVLRAEFLDVPVKGKVKVCFVDYGTVDMVDISQCRRMNKYFSLIPKLCFPGALELDPIKSGFIKESVLVQRFCKMVRNKPLCGYVTQVDGKNKSVRMVLIDTSDRTKDFIINREMLAV